MFIVTFLLKHCLHVKNDFQFLWKLFLQGPAQIIFETKDKNPKVETKLKISKL